MTGRPARDFDCGSDRDPDIERDLFAELAQPADSPDLTKSIMGKLGYMRVSPAVARRRRHRGRLVRLATCAAGVLLLGFGLRLHEAGPTARRPDGPTIHSALRNDVTRTQHHLDHALRTIKRLGTRLAPPREGGALPILVPDHPDHADHADHADPPSPAEDVRPAPTGVLPELIDADADIWDLGPARWL